MCGHWCACRSCAKKIQQEQLQEQFKEALTKQTTKQTQQLQTILQRIQTHGNQKCTWTAKKQNTTHSAEVLTPTMLMSPPISSLPMSSPNEDAISECVKEQLVQHLAKYGTLELRVSRGRIEEMLKPRPPLKPPLKQRRRLLLSMVT